jgi:hypothetical protein
LKTWSFWLAAKSCRKSQSPSILKSREKMPGDVGQRVATLVQSGLSYIEAMNKVLESEAS